MIDKILPYTASQTSRPRHKGKLKQQKWKFAGRRHRRREEKAENWEKIKILRNNLK
jgi:hypothetical protein